jgi:hypothetical protein
VSPHTRFIPLVVGVVLLTAACGSRDDESRPAALPSAASLPPAPSPQPSVILPPPTYTPVSPGGVLPPTWVPPTYAYPTGTTATTTTAPPSAAPLTKSPTPTPAHAAKCSGEPTGAQILALVKKQDGIPKKTLQVREGPFCADTWSFTVLKLAGVSGDQEPLNVVASGSGSSLAFITAGSDVCNPQVQSSAPAGIRVLACGY